MNQPIERVTHFTDNFWTDLDAVLSEPFLRQSFYKTLLVNIRDKFANNWDELEVNLADSSERFVLIMDRTFSVVIATGYIVPDNEIYVDAIEIDLTQPDIDWSSDDDF